MRDQGQHRATTRGDADCAIAAQSTVSPRSRWREASAWHDDPLIKKL
jgi:hypothetical protein